MGVVFSKGLALTTYCLARQGERSIDFALSCEAQWQLLRGYYGHDRMQPLHDLLREMTRLHPDHPTTYAKDRLVALSLIWVSSYPIRSWVNRWRDNWSFTPDEVSFFIDSISRLIAVLAQERQPAPPSLVDLRMDLHFCQRIIQRRLVGVPLLKQARDVEHFCQADHVATVPLSGIAALAAR